MRGVLFAMTLPAWSLKTVWHNVCPAGNGKSGFVSRDVLYIYSPGGILYLEGRNRILKTLHCVRRLASVFLCDQSGPGGLLYWEGSSW